MPAEYAELRFGGEELRPRAALLRARPKALLVKNYLRGRIHCRWAWKPTCSGPDQLTDGYRNPIADAIERGR
ncbi:hypothetical protein OH799_31070 [Nocardia sp. NBC_00881]|uniref:hypothetical protein n=1 Tax=Nocardia sp. NBC_00881 TaxID=2975995 RepID=UPI0038674FF7|nr:hypothetical protein OH799_31070 [Nocardia sp. NBC_00881]